MDTLLQNDRVTHMLIGFIVCGISLTATYDILRDRILAILPGIMSVFMVGCFKEYIWDEYMLRGSCENTDLYMTFLGGAVFILLWLVLAWFDMVREINGKKSKYPNQFRTELSVSGEPQIRVTGCLINNSIFNERSN